MPDGEPAHIPVLLHTYVEALCRDADGRYVDCTFGRGGHARALLARLSPQGRLLALVRGLPHASQVAAVRERLIVPTQVEGPRDILVPGEIAGTAEGSGPGVDDVYVSAGRPLTAAGGGQPAVVLEQAFARQNQLPDTGTLRVSGGTTVRYSGVGQSPEYFIVTAGLGGAPFLSQKSYAVLFTTLPTAQALGGLKISEPLPDSSHLLFDASSQAVLIHVPPAALALPSGRSGWAPDGYVCYSKVCTHLGCPTSLYQAQDNRILCPCHQSTFDVLDGARPTFGPAVRPLPQLPIQLQADGTFVATGAFSGPIGPSFWNIESGALPERGRGASCPPPARPVRRPRRARRPRPVRRARRPRTASGCRQRCCAWRRGSSTAWRSTPDCPGRCSAGALTVAMLVLTAWARQ